MSSVCKTRIVVMIMIALSASGCVAVPRIDVSQRIEFNYVPSAQQPMGRSEALCCAKCTA